MIPIAMIYATPEDSVAEIAYIEKRGYPISYVEMGEEPDGHYTPPEDYAALYVQWATALHKLDPKLQLGGPIFTGVNKDIETWPDAQGRTSWTARFIDYLKAHGSLADLSFFSFEHYPMDPCKIQWSNLYDEPSSCHSHARHLASRRRSGEYSDVHHRVEYRLAIGGSVHKHVGRALAGRLCGLVPQCRRQCRLFLSTTFRSASTAAATTRWERSDCFRRTRI